MELVGRAIRLERVSERSIRNHVICIPPNGCPRWQRIDHTTSNYSISGTMRRISREGAS